MRTLAHVIAVGLAISGAAAAQVQTWKIDPAHTAAQFSVRHLGISTVRGAFTKVSGTVQYDPADPAKSIIEATIDATSIDTRNDMRDKDLRGANFFDVEKFPTLTFKSKHVDAAGTGKLKVSGDLTMHGVTKEVVLDVDGLAAPVKDGRGNLHLGASASTTVNRTDFGISGASAMVGSDIQIIIDIEMTRPAVSS